MMIGKIKGYSIFDISKGTLKKEDFFDEIKNKDSKIKEKIEKILQNKGLAWGLKKDKKLKAVYLFEAVEEDNKKILRFTEKIILEEITNEIQEKFEKDLITEFTELVSLEDYAKVEWDGNTIIPKTVKVGKYNIPLGSLMFLICIIFGILMDDLVLGICVGSVLGCSFAVIVKKNDKNSKND